MRVVRGVPERASYSSALTIGNFDGLHLGHVELLRRLKEAAGRLGLPAVAMTFEPHPREFFLPQNAPARLSSLREKLELMQVAGVDCVHVCRFDARFAALGAEAFIEDLLVRGLSVRHLIVGDDFRFGHRRVGDFEMLSKSGAAFGFVTERTPSVEIDGIRVSSSAVREALGAGDLDLAARLLGRPYSISGRVVAGAQIGRTLGFPTANIGLKERRPPLSGVFAVNVSGVVEGVIPGVANVGVRPTVGGQARVHLEVHLLDFSGSLYGRHVHVNFLHKLREEKRFDSLEMLKAGIVADVECARAYFGAGGA